MKAQIRTDKRQTGSGVGTHSRMLTNSPTEIPLCILLYSHEKSRNPTSIASRKIHNHQPGRMQNTTSTPITLTIKNLPVDRSTHAHERSKHWFKAGVLPPKEALIHSLLQPTPTPFKKTKW
ncbi:hypothetical protein KC19_3G004000 [Ceratodon purpureus]|uniref:Uncharacterized protein n=1 Tax=Ceratodon purpureus TaxID=3225 RepID=A0A8T0IGR3_CERPU|nr:hypothetical protein KC19_3G004000 [Ceratodon purpureus]